MIDDIAERAIGRLLDRMVAAAEDLPPDLAIERGDDRLTITGRAVRLRALTDARIAGVAAGLAVRR